MRQTNFFTLSWYEPIDAKDAPLTSVCVWPFFAWTRSWVLTFLLKMGNACLRRVLFARPRDEDIHTTSLTLHIWRVCVLKLFCFSVKDFFLFLGSLFLAESQLSILSDRDHRWWCGGGLHRPIDMQQNLVVVISGNSFWGCLHEKGNPFV